MRCVVCIMGLAALARMAPGCDLGPPATAAVQPRLMAAGDLNNLYVLRAEGAGDAAAFHFWHRDARGTWHDGGSAPGTPVAAAAWRENLVVFFPSGRYGLFGLTSPVIRPPPVPAWVPAAADEDGLAIDAFGWNAAAEPLVARYEEGNWSWRRVEADLKRGKVLDPSLARFGGRLYIVWREEEPTLTGSAPNFRLWFVYQEKDAWHVPLKSRLYVASAPQIAATAGTMACLFQKAAADGKPDQWTLATYAVADEDWHENGPVTGRLPAGPLAFARSAGTLYVAALAEGRPAAAPLDVRQGRVGEFQSFVPEQKAPKPRTDLSGIAVFALACLTLLLLVAGWRRARRSGAMAPEGGARDAGGRPLPGQPPEAPGFVAAPLLRRAAALVIDYVLLGVLMAPAIVHLWPDFPDRVLGGPNLTVPEMFVLQAVRFGFILVYFTVAEGLFGRSLGKRLMGLRVATELGAQISFGQSAARNVLRLVDELPAMYLLGLLLVVIGPRPQRLGDRVARTQVVMVTATTPQGPPAA